MYKQKNSESVFMDTLILARKNRKYYPLYRSLMNYYDITDPGKLIKTMERLIYGKNLYQMKTYKHEENESVYLNTLTLARNNKEHCSRYNSLYRSLINYYNITDPGKLIKILDWLIYGRNLYQPNDNDFKMVICDLKKARVKFPRNL